MNKFFPDNIWRHLAEKYKMEKRTFLFTFFLGVIIYLRMITLWLTNPDGVWQGMVYKSYYGWEDILGRVGLGVFNRWKGYYQFPALQTIFCILIAAVIAVLLCCLLEIRKYPWNYIVGGLVICSPSLCSTLTYYYTADAYLLAYLFAVLFVWCLVKRHTWKHYILAVVLLAVSASIYQAYIGSAITLCLLYLLFGIIRNNESAKQLISRGCRFLTAGGCALALYLLSYKMMCRWKGISPVADRGFDSMGKIPLGRIPMLIKQSYHYFFSYYFTDELYNNTWMGRGKLNMLAAIIILVVLVRCMAKREYHQKVMEIVIAIVAVLLIPMAFMSIVIMAPECSIAGVTGILMLPHMNWIYIFGIALAVGRQGMNTTDWQGVVAEWTVLFTLGGLLFILGLYTQVFQNCIQMDLHRIYALAQQIVGRVNSEADYTPGLALVIGGDEEQGNYPRPYEDMYQVVKGTAAEYGLVWDSANGRQNCWNQFFRQYMGLEYSVSAGEQSERILSGQEYAEMSVFPADGSVKIIEGCVVVKLSD